MPMILLLLILLNTDGNEIADDQQHDTIHQKAFDEKAFPIIMKSLENISEGDGDDDE